MLSLVLMCYSIMKLFLSIFTIKKLITNLDQLMEASDEDGSLRSERLKGIFDVVVVEGNLYQYNLFCYLHFRQNRKILK